jgi:hypothetical protein
LYAGRAGGIGASNNDLSRESGHERETRAPDEDLHRLLGPREARHAERLTTVQEMKETAAAARRLAAETRANVQTAMTRIAASRRLLGPSERERR